MEWPETIWYVALAAGSVVAAVWAVHVIWHVRGQWRIRRAGPRRLQAIRHRIWHEPSHADAGDLRFGPGGPDGVPKPPFEFVEEHLTGSQPCVAVRDARGRLWRVKWGHEARPESFAVRIAWACGYFAEVTHYLPAGTINNVGVRMLFNEHSWAWDDNPFLGTKQLAGLRIVNMLLSNWDTKDRRDVARGSNTAIFELATAWGREARYLITDWGGAMGKWGSNVVARDRWDAAGYQAQTPQFVTGVRDEWVNFGYQGQRTAEIARSITVEDVEWFYRYARRLKEPAVRQALLACGATDDEARRFAGALIERIQQLGEACGAVQRPAKAG
jgi:hypothetical protein